MQLKYKWSIEQKKTFFSCFLHLQNIEVEYVLYDLTEVSSTLHFM